MNLFDSIFLGYFASSSRSLSPERSRCYVNIVGTPTPWRFCAFLSESRQQNHVPGAQLCFITEPLHVLPRRQDSPIVVKIRAAIHISV